ncbi:MAG: ribosome silencing factor [Bacteroidetes bacterium]|nr:ribosome silencing factor [Bacteroidota bacterium]
MPGKKKREPREILIGAVGTAMTDKIARDPVILDFTGLNGTVCDAFVICHGSSRTQVEAIAGHVIEEVKKKTGLNPYHQEGFENAEWILIDYFDVIIHIFQEERRKFYNIEQLWADARITTIDTHE